MSYFAKAEAVRHPSNSHTSCIVAIELNDSHCGLCNDDLIIMTLMGFNNSMKGCIISTDHQFQKAQAQCQKCLGFGQ